MLSIDVFKDSLRKLEKKFIIVNKGKNNIESYFVNDLEINDTSYGESTDITINSSDLDNIGMDILVEEGLEGLEGIGSEKGKTVEISMISESGDILRNGLRKEDCENRQCENEFYAIKYMNSLEQEVRFLREEIKNKNKIIELLVQDTVKRDEKFLSSHYNSTNNQDEFISPKTSVKAKNQDEFIFPKTSVIKATNLTHSRKDHYIHTNKFQILSENYHDDNINHQITSHHNEEKTQHLQKKVITRVWIKVVIQT